MADKLPEKNRKNFAKIFHLSREERTADLQSQLENLRTDEVTNLRPRKVFEQEAKRYLNQISRKNSDGTSVEHFGVLMLDIGNFKNFNDTYGHDAGDSVLKVVSDGFKQTLRSSDITGRYGGDELIAILTDISESVTPGERAELISDRINQFVSLNLPSGLQDKPIKIFVDVGIAYGEPDDSLDSKKKIADQMMYQNKEKRKSLNS